MWPFVTTNDIDGQTTAMMRWYGLSHRDEGSYDRLKEIKCPTLTVWCQQDGLVPEQNSIVMWQQMSKTNANVQIHIYPDSGHGFLFEFHEHCARLINEFLDIEILEKCGCEYCDF
jgi:pimeloyl-ACP methyl ester carboxylesterase